MMTEDRIEAALGRALEAYESLAGYSKLERLRAAIAAYLATLPASEVECDLCRGYGLTSHGQNCARCGGSGVLAATPEANSEDRPRCAQGKQR